MPGVIEEMASWTEEIAERERAHDREREVHRLATNDRQSRRWREDARRHAMAAARQMTGRVIFPARWDVVKDPERVNCLCCRATLEGRVRIEVSVRCTDTTTAEVTVYLPDPSSGAEVSWTRPGYRNESPPLSPGRDWFRRALVELGVI